VTPQERDNKKMRKEKRNGEVGNPGVILNNNGLIGENSDWGGGGGCRGGGGVGGWGGGGRGGGGCEGGVWALGPACSARGKGVLEALYSSELEGSRGGFSKGSAEAGHSGEMAETGSTRGGETQNYPALA